MAYLSDLRFRNGHWIDTASPDYIFGTNDADTINIYAGDNAVSAGGGNDVIFDVHSYAGWYSGADKVYAGTGDDLIVTSLDGSGNQYYGDAGLDTINCIPAAHGVSVNLSNHTMADLTTGYSSSVWTIENVTGSAHNDVITGDAQDNALRGYNGADWLFGQGGHDQLWGGRGHDVLYGGEGSDTLNGEDGFDWLHGDGGSDALWGGADADHLDGGLGRDSLWGEGGADFFEFWTLADSGASISTADTIADFVHLVDRIDVSAIDARATQSGDQAFTFIGTAAFSAAGQIRYVVSQQSQDTFVYLNTDNDTAAEMVVRLDPVTALSAQDFVL